MLKKLPCVNFNVQRISCEVAGDVTGMWDARADIALLDCRGDRLGRSLSQETAFAGSGALA